MSLIPLDAFPKISRLNNGITLATIPVKSELSTIGYWVGSGSVYESPEDNGVAHFLEHILFRGNEKYSKSHLERIADQHGINLMAATSRTITSFFAQVDKKEIPLAVDVLSQIVMNPKIEQQAVDNERATIHEEAFSVSHDFNEVIWDKLHELIYPDSALGRPILGSRENITSISAKQIQDHYTKFFNPSNCIFVCATSLPHEEIQEQLTKSTSFIKKREALNIGEINKGLKVDFKPNFRQYESPMLNTSWIALGIEAPGIDHPSYIAANVVKAAIGNVDIASHYEASPLLKATAIRHLNTHYFPYVGKGLLAFLGTTKDNQLQEWMNDIVGGIFQSTEEMTPENLAMAKRRLKTLIGHGMSSSRGIADELGQNLHFRGRWTSPQELFGRIDSTSKQDIVNFAATFLHQKPFGAVAITPSTPAGAERAKAAQTQKPADKENTEKKA